MRNEATSRILGRKYLIDQGLRKSWVWPLCGIPASAERHSGNTRRCGPVSRPDHRMCRGGAEAGRPAVGRVARSGDRATTQKGSKEAEDA